MKITDKGIELTIYSQTCCCGKKVKGISKETVSKAMKKHASKCRSINFLKGMIKIFPQYKKMAMNEIIKDLKKKDLW